MKKRIIMFVLAAIFVVVTSAGCAQETGTLDEKEAINEENAAVETSTITITLSDAVPRDGIEAVAAAAEEAVGITVEFDIIASAGAEDIQKTRLATGDIGDIWLNNPGAQMIVQHPEENMVDLSKYKDMLDEGFVNAASYNGKLYGVPTGTAGAGGMWYNTKVMGSLGIETPKSWGDFIASCETARAAGIIPIAGAFKDDWTAQIILLGDYYNISQADPEFYNNFEHNKAKYATSVAAFRSWEKLEEVKNYINEDSLATTLDVAMEMLANEECLYWPMLSHNLPTFAELYPEQANDIGFMPIPNDDPNIWGLTVWPSNTFHVYKESPNIEAALRFLDFYYSDEALKIYNENNVPVGPFHIKGAEPGDDVLPAIKQMVPFFEEGKTELAMEFFTSVKGPNCPALCIGTATGSYSAKEAAELYDQDCEKQAIQLGIEGW